MKENFPSLVKEIDMQVEEAQNNQSEQEDDKRIQKNEDIVSTLWNNFKRSNICIIGVPEE